MALLVARSPVSLEFAFGARAPSSRLILRPRDPVGIGLASTLEPRQVDPQRTVEGPACCDAPVGNSLLLRPASVYAEGSPAPASTESAGLSPSQRP
jgi:hypothetical protein